jgi:hypothetical protein
MDDKRTPEALNLAASAIRNDMAKMRIKADALDRLASEKRADAMREAAAVPVDRSKVTLTDGAPVPDDGSHTQKGPDGQQAAYVVLSQAERARGFVRPYRDAYRHVGVPQPGPMRDLTDAETVEYAGFGYVKFEAYTDEVTPLTGMFWTQARLDRLGGCGAVTTMGRALAETYARDPSFYSSGTFCSTCRAHFPVGKRGEFTWYEMDGAEGPRVGT